jgi:hypothetical protein
MIQHKTVTVVVCKTPAQGKLRASKMRGSIIRKFNPQRRTYAVTQAPVNVSKPKVWSPDTDLQDLQSHCEVKELAGAVGWLIVPMSTRKWAKYWERLTVTPVRAGLLQIQAPYGFR